MTTEIDKRAQIKFALKQGLEKGLEKGRAEGWEKGLESGRAEEKVQTAQNLKSEGVPVGIIAKCTDLTLEQIAAL